MDFPKFYRPERVGDLYVPDTASAVAAGRAANLTPAAHAPARTILLLVDMQVDFVHKDGSLSVPGAVDDTRRTIEWIFRNLTRPHDHRGIARQPRADPDLLPDVVERPRRPASRTLHRNPQRGRARRALAPLYEPDWSATYCARLEAHAKKELMIWPYHTLIGTPGHALTPALYEAIAYHAAARQAQPIFLQKGTIPRDRVLFDARSRRSKCRAIRRASLNDAFLKTLIELRPHLHRGGGEKPLRAGNRDLDHALFRRAAGHYRQISPFAGLHVVGGASDD